MIAALFVQKGGVYYGLPDVDPWDEERDARLYPGPWPVVAHPPCARWSRMASVVEARYGYKRGEDGGCFASALESVRRYSGVLEHPAFSAAWSKFGLPRPPSPGGWVRGICGGWACHVEQGLYGHPAPKATWLYAHGVEHLPMLRWGKMDRTNAAMVGWFWSCNGKRDAIDSRLRVSKDAASKTPPEFKAVLLGMARSVKREAA